MKYHTSDTREIWGKGEEEDRKSLAQPLFPSVDIQDDRHSYTTDSNLFLKICVLGNKKYTADMCEEARGLILFKDMF